jgi:hypothetical protein
LLFLKLRVGRFFGPWQVPNIWIHSYRDSDSSISDHVSVRKKLNFLMNEPGIALPSLEKIVE